MDKKLVMNDDALYLPREIINNILQRLPVKSLIRFQCVSKEWKNLFKTQSFIAEHLRHSTQQNDFLLCKKHRFNQNPSVCLINRHMQVIKYEEVSSYVRYSCIVGSSNGLLCLQLWYLSLLNPATRVVFHVPKVKLRCAENEILWKLATKEGFHVSEVKRYTKCWDICGFGFSPIVNDYKIVMFSLSEIVVHDSYQICVGKVFSLRTNSWIEVEAGKVKNILYSL